MWELDISWFDKLVEWVGWPIAFLLYLIISTVIFIVQDRNYRFVKDRLEDLQNYRPDQLMERLQNRHKHQEEMIRDLETEKSLNEEQIGEERSKRLRLEAEMEELAEQSRVAMERFYDSLPREGRRVQIIEDQSLLLIQHEGKIIIPTKTMFDGNKRYSLDELNTKKGLFLTTEHNMGSAYMFVHLVDGPTLEVKNIYNNVYSKDYHASLEYVLATILPLGRHITGMGGGPAFDLPTESKFTNIINDGETYILEVPFPDRD